MGSAVAGVGVCNPDCDPPSLQYADVADVVTVHETLCGGVKLAAAQFAEPRE
jgi:hypothetical protein